MMMMIAESLGLFNRVGNVSLNTRVASSSRATLWASSTLCGSSHVTRSPRRPVIDRTGQDCLQPVASFSKYVFAFWSPASARGHRS